MFESDIVVGGEASPAEECPETRVNSYKANVISSDRSAPSARWYRGAAREGEKEQVVAREKTLNTEVRTAGLGKDCRCLHATKI